MAMTNLHLFDEPDIFEGLAEDDSGARWYQRDAHQGIIDGFKTVDSQLVVMATGLGKTFVACSVARDWQGRVLWLVHGDELVDQARFALEKMTGEIVEVEKAEMTSSGRSRIVVGSIDSVRRQNRLDRMGKDSFSLVIHDESHHALAKSYKKTLEWFSGKRLGLTATPDRGDEKALGAMFEAVAYCMDIEDGIADGHLVPLVGQRVFLKEIDLGDVHVSKGDLAPGELDEAMMKAVVGIVDKTMELQPDRRGLAFFPGVRSAQFAAERFNAKKPGSAAFVDGETDKFERKRIVADFRLGRIQYLCNCRVFTEGFDAPGANLIIQGAPTLSRAFYAQTVGRGTRPLFGVIDHLREKHQSEARRAAIARSAKPDCVVLDFVGNSGKHSLMTVEDVLGGNFSTEEVELAKKQRAVGKPEDARESLLKARRELLMRATVKARNVVAEVHPFDPFAVMRIEIKDGDRYTERFGIKPASEGKLSLLRAKGVPESELKGLSNKAASKLIDHLIERHRLGLCTYKQLRQLQRFGVLDTKITFDRAAAALTYIANKNWRPSLVDPTALTEILHHNRETGEEG